MADQQSVTIEILGAEGIATSQGDKFAGDVVTLPTAEARRLQLRGRAAPYVDGLAAGDEPSADDESSDEPADDEPAPAPRRTRTPRTR